ncbi:PREDICTED: F-box only protein 48 isoform X2 [Haliaeetus leucocephalus]|uniref:F-box only protein 48 isoform X2 n=1 Tax=Haliaeetus leucocephalus TaxID=52644 RepID=UPI00053CEADF|nr:PREDICTED: F-box only protein 48 isoform X2 [Haliaeetus leucocephalus]
MAGERSAAGRAALLSAGRETGRGGGGGGGPADFVALLPPEVSSRIFSDLDIESLCHAAVTCKGWHLVIESDDRLWRHHCLSMRAVCQREIDCDRGNGYSWKLYGRTAVNCVAQ